MKKSLFALAFSLLVLPVFGQQMQPWLTREADNSRSGWNSQETILTQASVRAKGMSLRTVIPVLGDARGMEAQPLILPGVQTSRGVRDVLVLPSMADVVRGVDAHDGTAIWQATLGAPILREIGEKHANRAEPVGLPALLERLGVHQTPTGITLDDHAELAHVRRAITFGAPR